MFHYSDQCQRFPSGDMSSSVLPWDLSKSGLLILGRVKYAQACLANIFLAGMEDGVSLERLSGSFFYIFLLSVLWKKVTNMKYGLWWRVQWGGCGAFWQPLALLAAVDRLTLGRFSLRTWGESETWLLLSLQCTKYFSNFSVFNFSLSQIGVLLKIMLTQPPKNLSKIGQVQPQVLRWVWLLAAPQPPSNALNISPTFPF